MFDELHRMYGAVEVKEGGIIFLGGFARCRKERMWNRWRRWGNREWVLSWGMHLIEDCPLFHFCFLLLVSAVSILWEFLASYMPVLLWGNGSYLHDILQSPLHFSFIVTLFECIALVCDVLSLREGYFDLKPPSLIEVSSWRVFKCGRRPSAECGRRVSHVCVGICPSSVVRIDAVPCCDDGESLLVDLLT